MLEIATALAGIVSAIAWLVGAVAALTFVTRFFHSKDGRPRSLELEKTREGWRGRIDMATRYRSGRILCIGSNAVHNAGVVSRIEKLQDELKIDIEVRQVETGEEAISWLARQNFDIIISDVQANSIVGKNIAEQSYDTPLIIFYQYLDEALANPRAAQRLAISYADAAGASATKPDVAVLNHERSLSDLVLWHLQRIETEPDEPAASRRRRLSRR